MKTKKKCKVKRTAATKTARMKRSTAERTARVEHTVILLFCPVEDWMDVIAELDERDEDEAELAHALERHTDPNDPLFDPEFTAELQRLRPDWFGIHASHEG